MAVFLEDGPLHTLGSRMHRDLDQSQWSSELTCRPRLHAVRLLCSPAGSGEACFYSTETVHFTVVQSGRAEGKSPPLSLKPQFVADTGGMCRISGSGFPTFFLVSSSITCPPCFQQESGEDYPDASDVSSTGEVERGMQRTSSVSQTLQALRSWLGHRTSI